MQVVDRAGALLGVTELDHDGAAFGSGDATLKDGARLVAVGARGADQVEARALVFAGAGEGLLPLVFPLLLFGETLVAAVVADQASGGGGGEGLAEGDADVILDLSDGRTLRDTGAEDDHADDEAGGFLTLDDRLAGGAAARNECDRAGETAALIGAIGEDDGRVGAHAFVRLVSRDATDRLSTDLTDAVLEVGEDDQGVVGAVVLEDIEPAADGARLEVTGVLLVDSSPSGGELINICLGRDDFSLGVLLGAAARRTIKERRTLKLFTTDDFVVMDVDEDPIAQVDVGVRELVADFRFDPVEVRKHRGRGVEIDRQALGEDVRAHDRAGDEVLAAAGAHTFTRADTAAGAAAEALGGTSGHRAGDHRGRRSGVRHVRQRDRSRGALGSDTRGRLGERLDVLRLHLALSALDALTAGTAARARGEGVRVLLGVIGDRGDNEGRGDEDQQDVDRQGDRKTAGADALPERALHALRSEGV